MNRRTSNYYLILFTLIFILIGSLLLINIFSISIKGIHRLSDTDVTQFSAVSSVKETIYAKRGYIFDRNGNIIAEDSVSYNILIFLDPSRPGYKDIPAYVPEKYKKEYSEILGEILQVDSSIILRYLNLDLYQTELGVYGRNLDKKQKEEIEARGLYGIEFTEQNSRNYPLGTFASHLIGYTRFNQEDEVLIGEMGVESLLNDYLLGKNGFKRYNIDAFGNELLGTQSGYVSAINGNNVYLTIDKSCQQALEVCINNTVNQFKAKKMWGAIMEVETGKILGWGCYPSFDPNVLEISNYLDLMSQYPYEPGSTMKTFTYAAAIDSGHYSHTDKYYSGTFYIGLNNKGELYRANHETKYGTINNWRKTNFGYITLDQAYYRSLNTGIATLVTDYITPNILETYLDSFGFFKRVDTLGISDVSSVKNMDYPVDQIASGYGQASTITGIQLLQAYSAIMNDGVMVKPYIVDFIEDSYTNKIVYQSETQQVGQPISANTANQVKTLMRGAVTDKTYGIAKYYNISNVKVIAKTGTGEIAVDGAYSEKYVTSSVVLGLPYDDPKIIVYLAFQANYSGDMNYKTGNTKRLLQKLVKYLNLHDGKVEPEEVSFETIDPNTRYENIMPALINHSVDYATTLLSQYHTKNIILGNGSNIILQYPNENETVTQGQKVMLLTSLDHFQMPNMLGWSRKDVTAFWKMTGIKIDITGYGFVTSQSIPAGTTLNAQSVIEVTLDN